MGACECHCFVLDTINQCVDTAEMTTLSAVIGYEEMQNISAEFTRLKGICAFVMNLGYFLKIKSILNCKLFMSGCL